METYFALAFDKKTRARHDTGLKTSPYANVGIGENFRNNVAV
jgi:hypothetical protein